MSDTYPIQHSVGGTELLDRIAPLWLMLREHHHRLRTHFREEINARAFDERKAQWQEFPDGGVLVDLALPADTEDIVGYCVTTIDARRTGEVDSLFVVEGYRGRGIGDAFMRRALAWLDEKGVEDRVIEVAAGNEQVLEFYARYGFFARRIVLKPVGPRLTPSAGPSPC